MKDTLHLSEGPKLLKGTPRPHLPKENAPAPVKPLAADSVFMEQIQSRAETISPLLRELLDFRPPPHWGIND